MSVKDFDAFDDFDELDEFMSVDSEEFPICDESTTPPPVEEILNIDIKEDLKNLFNHENLANVCLGVKVKSFCSEDYNRAVLEYDNIESLKESFVENEKRGDQNSNNQLKWGEVDLVLDMNKLLQITCSKIKLNFPDQLNKDLDSTQNLKLFRENFNYQKTKKNKENFFPISCFDNYMLFSNKGKKISTQKKNCEANDIYSFEEGTNLVVNTMEYIEKFFTSYTPQIDLNPDKYSHALKSNHFPIFLLTFHSGYDLRKKNQDYFNLVNESTLSKKKKKILKLPVVNSFYTGKLFKNTGKQTDVIFFSEQLAVVWLESSNVSVSK